MEYTLRTIGVIHTPYRRTVDIPRQGFLDPHTEGSIELFEDYRVGLEGLEGFSHAVLIFYFHKAEGEKLKGTPPGAFGERGVFAIRGPHRPNHLGLSVVKILRLTSAGFSFTGVDMLDGTPLLDIKPYVDALNIQNQRHTGFQGSH